MKPELQGRQANASEPAAPILSSAIDLVAALINRYEIKALESLLDACRSASAAQYLTVAVVGRFKAGKSSFLNQIIGRDLLPVGAIPVTSVITEIAWGSEKNLEIRFLDGRCKAFPASSISEFVSESQNPKNEKCVSSVRLLLPELARYRKLRFVDTPGLESSLGHNTETSLAWFPNVDVALVVISVDPPLTQQDVTLIRNLCAYTPRVSVVLTKVDLLTDEEREQVLRFVRSQLDRNFERHIPLHPYSVRPGYEHFRAAFDEEFLASVVTCVQQQKLAVLSHKVNTLLNECGDFLRLRLRSAEMLDSERQQLREHVNDRVRLADTRMELRLMATHSISGARAYIEKILKPYDPAIVSDLSAALESEYGQWNVRFAPLLQRFETWLRQSLTEPLSSISREKREEFLMPVHDLQRQYVHVLQGFRDALAERTLKLFGVPLRTAEVPMECENPKAPDVKIGRAFDHSWELLSAILPMTLLRKPVKKRFMRKVRDEVFKNLSRLTTQWLDIVAGSVRQLNCEAERRLSELAATVERMTAAPSIDLPQIRIDCEQIESRIAQLSGNQPTTAFIEQEKYQ